jgi:glycyl-tRNA synthetase (class II)
VGLTEDEVTVDSEKVFAEDPVEAVGLACRCFYDLPTHHQNVHVSLLELLHLLSRVGVF